MDNVSYALLSEPWKAWTCQWHGRCLTMKQREKSGAELQSKRQYLDRPVSSCIQSYLRTTELYFSVK